jgi:hypothetical protein
MLRAYWHKIFIVLVFVKRGMENHIMISRSSLAHSTSLRFLIFYGPFCMTIKSQLSTSRAPGKIMVILIFLSNKALYHSPISSKWSIISYYLTFPSKWRIIISFNIYLNQQVSRITFTYHKQVAASTISRRNHLWYYS